MSEVVSDTSEEDIYESADSLDDSEVGGTSELSDQNEDTLSLEQGSQDDDALTKQYGSITVQVDKANIVNQQVDVVVNSTTQTLDLKQGAASKSLLKKGGNSIQQECNDKYKDGIKAGEIAVTASGSLLCKQIYHLYLPKWEEKQPKTAIQNVMSLCLEKASQSGYTTIAFPALGTGNLGYSREFVAKAMFETVERFSSRNSSTSLTTVKFVLFPSDYGTIEAFTEACNRRSRAIRKSSDNSAKIGNISVNIAVGLLAAQNTDVIMTSCTRGLDLKRGTLSKSILDAGGSDLQTDCQTNYPGGIQHGEIAVLSPAKLKCKQVYCGALPRYDKPENGAHPQQLLETLITKCLQQASSDKMTSISFPTLGSGYLMYPPHITARIMFKSVDKFWKTDNSTSVQTVNIVVFKGSSSVNQTIQTFSNECKSWNVRPVVPPKTSRVPLPSSRGNSSQIPGRGTPEYCLHMYTVDVCPPSHWTVYTSDKTVKKWKIEEKGNQQYMLVDADQAVFKKVKQLVLRTWEPAKKGHGRDAQGLGDLDYTTLRVTKVQRLENLNLYEEYWNKKQTMFHKAAEGQMFTKLLNIEGLQQGCSKLDKYLDKTWKDDLHEEVNEGFFFHGTKKDRVQGLLSQGLDPRMAEGASVLGKAIYMAESSTKADQYTDSRDGERSTHSLQMLLVRASLGKICLMKDVRKMRRPPCCVENCADDGCNHEDRFDSVIEESKFIFREFVVYDRQQVYPEYVITYDRV